MARDEEGFLLPSLSLSTCSGCGRCEAACPSLRTFLPRTPLGVYAVQHTDEAIRLSSSSGGVFSALAERVLASGGIVYGASLDSTLRVVHRGIEDLRSLPLLRGSKYVQSESEGLFREIRDHLRNGRCVLFSGTPCQISGLCSFLKQVPESLVCVDFVCHGVPSPKVFHLWKTSMEQLYRSRAIDISFRRKDDGWHRFSLALTFENGQLYRGNVKEEPFLRGFLANLFLRPSCHSCRFKSLRGFSDVTIADFWGVKNTLPAWDDDRGTSLVMVNTEKGARIFSSCSDRMRCQAVPFEDAVASNPAIIRTSSAHPRRDPFFKQLGTRPIDRLLKKYVRIALRRRIKWGLKRLCIQWRNRGREL